MSLADRFQGVWSPSYLKRLAFMLGMGLIIVGALNWLALGLFDVNPLEQVFGKSIASFLYVLVGVSALAIMFDRDTYLPFLSSTVVPCSVLKEREPPGSTKAIKVIVTPNTKVLYWASEPAAEKLKHLNSWKEAYATYQNAGVTTSNADGVAILKVLEPQSYKVPFMGKLESHVHYRVCGEAGFMGRVETAYLNHAGPEGFESEQGHNVAFMASPLM
uniref:Uncharacterized protein n=1 Tax=viral metagenome TaxID=1070528 RepID=A0A6C0HKN4_9ZZZZ